MPFLGSSSLYSGGYTAALDSSGRYRVSKPGNASIASNAGVSYLCSRQ